MQYVMLINSDERAEQKMDPKTMNELMQDYTSFSKQAAMAGKLLRGDRLRPSAEALRVRVREGKVSVLDGPFVETKEVLGGYWVFECANREEALEWASKSPAAKWGTCDVREVYDSPNATAPQNQRRAPGAGGGQGKQRWMMLVLGENKAFARWSDDMGRIAEGGQAFFDDVTRSGIAYDGCRLHHERSAFQVRRRDGKTTVIDGPFAETKEVLGGFFVLEVDAKAQAIEWAARFPGAKYGVMELRQTWPVG